ncbi:MAG: hypothetical protein M1282_03085 [Chloroflexi bacterium]|nr:hypothetical protein [Chloroflexota bacterium]
MKNNGQLKYLALVMILAGTLTACANKPVSTTQLAENPQVAAINNFRAVLGLPNLPLESTGMDHMANSPSGDLPVALYADSQGRKFSVEPITNTVVEMDARALLASIPTNALVLPADELKARALKIANTITPGFDSLLPNLNDNSGNKGDNYFFDWRKPMEPGKMMPAFLQIGIHTSGLIFAYYNTLSLK